MYLGLLFSISVKKFKRSLPSAVLRFRRVRSYMFTLAVFFTLWTKSFQKKFVFCFNSQKFGYTLHSISSLFLAVGPFQCYNVTCSTAFIQPQPLCRHWVSGSPKPCDRPSGVFYWVHEASRRILLDGTKRYLEMPKAFPVMCFSVFIAPS